MEILNKDNFDQTIASGTVVVDFFAPWCGPCKMIMPTLEGLSQEYAGRATIVKVDADESPELAQRYDVTSIPNLIVFKDGEIVNRTVGYQTKDQLIKLIESGL